MITGATYFAPVPLQPWRNRSPQPFSEQEIRHTPYWLRVLAQGVSYIPEPLKMDINSWGKDAIKTRAYEALNVALMQNQRVRSGKIPLTDENMNEIINNSKYGQFLLESLNEEYEFTQELPPLMYNCDPVRARLFCELSRSILHHLMTTVDNPSLIAFDDFDIKLLKSAI